MRSDLQCLDHVRIAVMPACLWLIGGGTESRPVMSLQHASRRRAAIEGTLQVKGHDAVSVTHSWAPVLRRCSGREVDGRRYQGIHTSERPALLRQPNARRPRTSWSCPQHAHPQDESCPSDGGVPGRGPTQPIAPYRAINCSAEVSL